jgi:hypothetical protein
VEVPAVSKHLINIYESGELIKESTISILETVQLANKCQKRKPMKKPLMNFQYSIKHSPFYLISTKL